MQVQESTPASSTELDARRTGIGACIAAVSLFAAMSLYCGIRSEGFIAADACTHYLAARYAWQNPINFVDVWNRPLVTALYAGPAMLGGREAVRVICMFLAVGCGIVGFAIAKGQRLVRPELALIFTLGQPLLFLHSFGEMTELPFALLLGLAFLAWQRERFWLMAALVAWTPLARPEGFGFVAIAGAALLLRRKWPHVVLLPVPIILWDVAGWIISHHAHPLWRWLIDSWPYSGESLYGRGYLLTFVALLPAVVSPVVLPAVFLGIWRSLVPSPLYSGERLRVRGDVCEKHPSPNGPSPQPSPPSTGERKQESFASAKADGTGEPNAIRRVGELAHHGSSPSDTMVGEYAHPTIASGHIRLCIFLTAAIPLFVLIVHSLLHWLGKMASLGEPRYMLVVAPFWGVLAARGWEWTWSRLHWQHSMRWAAIAVLFPVVVNLLHPAVPVGLSHDWQSAREMARWYQAYSANSRRHTVLAAHPGIVYFLEMNPHDCLAMGLASLDSAPKGTALIWDPVFCETNASPNVTLTLDEIHLAGWKEIPAPDPYEPQADSFLNAVRDPNNPRSHWHAFVRPE